MSTSPPAPSADALRILLAGESWVTHITHLKGFDQFHTTDYTEGATHFLAEIRSVGHDVRYLPSHEVPTRFPASAEELGAYDVVILSDVGSNTFLLPPATFSRSEIGPNRLEAIATYVEQGGALLMIGGYLSFAGIDGRARYGSSPLARVLPVAMLDHDDRVEVPQGLTADVVAPEHAVLEGVPSSWPRLLGYNRVRARAGATVIAACGDDPILVVGEHGAGRTAAFTSDLAPHWAPPEFVQWDGYLPLWSGLLGWLAERTAHDASDGRVSTTSVS